MEGKGGYSEGKAVISGAGAFLNPHARVSRDISVAYLACTANKDSTLLDSTAASGIRGVRYVLESGLKHLTSIDMNKEAFASMSRNFRKNRIKAQTANTSLQEFANSERNRFDFIDIDPFGGITPYIYDAMKISKDGTHLMVTATDTAVLCGASAKACMRLYGTKPIHNELSHEFGLRTLIGYIVRTAAQFNMGVNVKLALSHRHYMRVFVRLANGSASSLESMSRMGYLHYCAKCHSWKTETDFLPKRFACGRCGEHMAVYGPAWMGGLKDKDIAEKVARWSEKHIDFKESVAVSNAITSELDIPFYYYIPTVTKAAGIGSVSPLEVITALKASGFAASHVHSHKSSIKTDAGFDRVEKAVMDLKAKRP